MIFKKELKKLGLKDKEAAVYLTCLQLGPSPAQEIAKKSEMVRATTYVVLDGLMRLGIVTKYKEGKKTMFAAEPPRLLMRLLEKQEETVEEKKRELERLLPELQVLVKAAGGQPTVRYFEGSEGIRAIRREMLMYSRPGDTWYSFTPVDHLEALVGNNERDQYYRQRVAKRIKGKSIFTTRSPRTRRKMMLGQADKLVERRFVSYDIFPSASGMTIFRDRIALGSFTGNVGGVIIESPNIADMMRRLFELAWRGADTE